MTNSSNSKIDKMSKGFSPFVVVGASKSGTTWVQKVLDSHPEVRCHFQLPIFPLVGRPDLWYRDMVVYDAGKSPFRGVFKDKKEEEKYYMTLRFFNRLELLRRDYVTRFVNGVGNEQREFLCSLHQKMLRGIVREVLQDTGVKTIFGTKAYTDLDLLFEVFPGAKVIQIVRDGRDVCVSRRFHTMRQKQFYLGDERNRMLRILHSWSPTKFAVAVLRSRIGWFGEKWFRIPGEDGPLFQRNVLAQFAMDWKLIVRYLLERQCKYPNNCLRIRYEDLLHDTETEVRRMLQFLGAGSSDEIVRDLIDKTSFRKLQKKSKDGFFRKGESGDWQNHFTSADTELFKGLAGDLLLELGYESSDEWTTERRGQS